MSSDPRRPLLAIAGAVLLLGTAGCAVAPDRATPRPTPSGMPSVALLPGRVVASSSGGPGDWLVSVHTDDPEAGYRRARALLVDSGFVLTKDREAKGGGDGQACTAQLCVGFTGSGTTVAYEVFLPATAGAP